MHEAAPQVTTRPFVQATRLANIYNLTGCVLGYAVHDKSISFRYQRGAQVAGEDSLVAIL